MYLLFFSFFCRVTRRESCGDWQPTPTKPCMPQRAMIEVCASGRTKATTSWSASRCWNSPGAALPSLLMARLWLWDSKMVYWSHCVEVCILAVWRAWSYSLSSLVQSLSAGVAHKINKKPCDHSVQCCFTSTETIRLIRDREPMMATLTFTQLLSSVMRLLGPLLCIRFAENIHILISVCF